MASKTELKELISAGRTEKAISRLLEITSNTDWYNEVIQQSAKYEQYQQLKRQGTQSTSDLNVAISRINESLLQIIDKLPSSSEFNEKVISKDLPERKKTLWRYIAAASIIIGILGSLAEFLNYINIVPNGKSPTGSYTVTVLVHGKEGKDDLILPNRGVVYLIYGDAKIPEQINNEGEATFKQIPADFFEPTAKVEILFQDPKGEPYRVAYPDSLYTLKQKEHIALQVVLLGMDQISGIVENFETGKPIEGANVRIHGVDTDSNEYGEFTLNIPIDKQKQFITIRAYKEGYQGWEMKDVPTTTGREIKIPLKPEK